MENLRQRLNIVRCLKPFPSESVMSREEIDLVLEVIEEVLEELGVRDAYGACILDGQKFGEEAGCVLRFNLMNDRAFEVFRREHDGRTCVGLAEAAIDGLLGWPEDASYHACEQLWQGDEQAAGSADVPSGIYRADDLKVMVLNTTHGRFLFSMYLSGIEQDADMVTTAVMLAVTQVIGDLRTSDFGLQMSSSAFIDWLNIDGLEQSQMNYKAVSVVANMIDEEANQIVAAWWKWCDEYTKEHGRQLGEFFQ